MPTTHHQPNPNRSRRRSQILVGTLVAALAVGLPLAALSRLRAEPAAKPPSPPPPTVIVAPVERRMVTDYAKLIGHVDATETVDLRARVSGHIEAVNFQAGQLVKKGDVLFTIDRRWYKAEFDLASARAEVAVREAARAERLLASSAVSNEEVEVRKAAAAEAEAALEIARLDLEHTLVRAPISGRVSRALVTSGNLVSGTPGNATLLATIVTVGNAYVYADLDEDTLLRFTRLAREGRIATHDGHIPADLELGDESGYPRHGYLESTDNHVNPSTGTLMLRFVFPNADGALIPGLYARVRVPVDAPAPKLLISERAIGTDQSQKFVYAVDPNDHVAYRTVELGSDIDGMRVVTKGLAAGDTIIVSGLQRVRPGMTVSPEPESVADASPDSGRTLALAR